MTEKSEDLGVDQEDVRLLPRLSTTTSTAPVTTVSDKHFADWESHVFGFGYGDGEAWTLDALGSFFAAIPIAGRTYDYRILEQQLGGTIAWLLINTLCHDDVLEYGTSSRFGWLTPKGELLREYMAGKTVTELYDVAMDDEGHNNCYPDYCNCTTPCNNPLFAR